MAKSLKNPRGAGRPLGSTSSKTLKIINEAMEKGVTPLQIMLEVMHEKYQGGDKDGAVSIAKDAAPYVHPRLQPRALGAETEQTVNININSKDISDAVAAAIAEYKLSN